MPTFSTFLPLLALFSPTFASGFLELSLQSPFKQDVAVGIFQESTAPFGSIKSLKLRANEPDSVSFPVYFNQTAKIVITVGGSPSYGLETSRFDTVVTPEKGVLAPDSVPAPFNGFRIAFGCHRDFYGEQCLQICKDDVAKTFGKRCNSAGFTSCPRGFMGQLCTEKIRPSQCPCKNGGQCATSFLSSTQEVPLCECPGRFYGPICQSERPAQKVKIVPNYTPELRFVPQIVEKYYNGLASDNLFVRV